MIAMPGIVSCSHEYVNFSFGKTLNKFSDIRRKIEWVAEGK